MMNRLPLIRKTTGLLAGAFLLLSSTVTAQTNVYDDVIATSPNHTTLAAALQATGLDAALQNQSATLTVFAPDNTAFNNLATALNTNTAGLLALPNLSDILQYHVLGMTISASAINNGDIETPLHTMNTVKLTKTSMGNVFVNQAQVNAPDLNAGNGVVHSIDAVLLPDETVADVAIDNNFSTLVTAVVTAELLPVLTDPFAELTVFAPDNDAFDDLATELGVSLSDILALPNLADILTYHVLGSEVMSGMINNGDVVQPVSMTNTLKLTAASNGDVFINQAQVFLADVGADNGVVHAIDAVVLPDETVADIAIDNNFSTLVTAVATAELLPVITDPFAELTVFAPDNDAFDDLATELGVTLNDILALPNLADILTYHVLGSEVMSGMINNGDVVQPVSMTNTLKLTAAANGDVFINQAQVFLADVSADNGVVHAIDAVVLPDETVADIAIDNNFSTLVTAVATAELLPVITDPFAELTVFAPDNDAFDDLVDELGTDLAGLLADPDLADILTYHVLGSEVMSGMINNGDIVQPVSTSNTLKLTVTGMGEVFVNQAEVILADVGADNGVVHALDEVVLPSETVVDVAIDNNFTSLTAAVVTAELLPALSDPFAEYTVFAPTDGAFADLATALSTDLAGVLALPNLADILLYHVVDGTVMSSALTAGPVTMLNGAIAIVDLSNGVMIDQATVDTPDVMADNGVVHIIDAVINPANATSVNEIEAVSISVYPNPAVESIMVTNANNSGYQVVDLTGSVVLQGWVNGNQAIDVTKLDSGVYFLNLENGDAQTTARFVKQ